MTTVIVLGGLGWLTWHLLVGRWQEETEDAYVQGDIVTVTPQTGGTVVAIGAEDGQKVLAGQILVRFDRADAQAAYAQAEAGLATAVRQVRGLHRAVEAGQAESRVRAASVQQARTTLAAAEADVSRRTGLVATGAVSAEELAHARSQRDNARAALAAAEAALSSTRDNMERNRVLVEGTDVRDNPQVLAAAAQFRQAWINRQRTEVIAPVDGYVAKRSVQLGQRIAPGTPLMAVIPLQDVWVDANFKETQLKKLRLGQRVELTSELYGDEVIYHGKLESLGLGTGSAFSILPAQNASGNWIKIVQRIPVRIALDPKELREHPLRLGLSMAVKVDLRDAGHGLLPAAPTTAPAQGTDAYARQLTEAETAADKIIAAHLGG
nr:efflux RND transporter periplasmic adaptor subunit [Lysobacter pythonis]